MSTDGLHTLGRWTRDRAVATPDRVAIDDRGVVVTYRDLDARATALAEGFLAAGYGIGDRVATLTGNSADHVVLFFACAKAGLVLVPLCWRLSPREVAEQLELSDPALVLVEDEFASLAASALERLGFEVAVGTLGTHGIEREMIAPLRRETDPVEQRAVRDDDALLIIFTSGTLARAKGAILTHANCFWTNLSLSRTAEITSGDTVLAVLPQYHVGGWNIQPLLAWWMGATVVLERTFDPGRVLHLIADRRITTMMGVPANYLQLAQHPRFARSDLSSLTHAVVGGAPMPEPLLRVWHGRGVALQQGYGLTEASPNVLCLPDEHARDRVGSAGKPYPHVEVAVADVVTGEHLDGEATGELLVAGPGVFAGYFRAPEQTERAMRGSWLATGDLVHRDADGYFRIVDRLGDIFISGGESIAPAEIEAVLLGHPAVADACVIGVPDQQWGEVGVAWIVPRAGQLVEADDILGYCATELARFKLPKTVRVTAEIPRTANTGKVLRRALLERWLVERDSEQAR
ncbi:AMP-binding protein [Leifsonia sp. H3M29-4]|uniref:class I adenylate-forming enzyme family protein n=1 Tax=Salinibacterium metalliresistens TaxID=3031321 RepID=UPI0023DA783C|nr:AMP-binding protein [Salinibacterium metalliresistens]MDF1480048.1 AMP-binding protein [Salinibacterium metalliresistens]